MIALADIAKGSKMFCMNEAEFVEALENCIEGMSGKLTATVEFRTVDGWDSLAMLFLLNTVDEVFGVQLDAVSIGNCRTLRDVYQQVQVLKV